MVINTTFLILVIALITLVILFATTMKNKSKNKLYSSFSTIIIMFIIHISGLIAAQQSEGEREREKRARVCDTVNEAYRVSWLWTHHGHTIIAFP